MPIRVLHIVGIMNMGGIENFLMNVYRNIDKEKIQFDFLVTREENGIFDEEIKFLGGKIYNIPHIKKIGYTQYVKKIHNFFVQNNQYKIVHCHRDALCAIYLREAKKAGVLVRIAHSHTTEIIVNNDLKGKIGRVIKWYFKTGSKKYANEYFACSQKAGNWLFGKKIADEKVKLVKNGVDLNKYVYLEKTNLDIRKELGIDKETFVVGHIGSFTEPKNHKFIIQLFNEVKKDIPNSKLLLIGGGALENIVRNEVKSLNLDRDVEFLGIRKDVNKILMCMDLFIFPSLFEGLPIAVIEAQMSGVKCIISDTITKEVDLDIELIKQISFKRKDLWKKYIKEIYSEKDIIRSKRSTEKEKIIQRGYNIESTVKYLENYYSDKIERENK